MHCETQKEVDYYWEKLLAGGAPSQCGWLKDKFGLSWQIVPDILPELLGDKDPQEGGPRDGRDDEDGQARHRGGEEGRRAGVTRRAGPRRRRASHASSGSAQTSAMPAPGSGSADA